MSILSQYTDKYKKRQEEVLSLEEYLIKAKEDASMYASPAERILKAIGEPAVIDTSKDSRLSRIFGNRIIRQYEVFKDFFGMEDTIEKIVSFFRHAAQGLEEANQILYLLGPVGSAKSSLAERLKQLIEQEPIYVLRAGDQISPLHESPLGLFTAADADHLGIPARALKFKMSPWARKRLKEFNGDISKFQVVKTCPSQLDQIAVSKTEPGDENNQDISSLVGKINIRMLEHLNQNDPDAYNYSGGLCLGNRGILEFVEMFKAPIKMLHPLLTATQEHNYEGTEKIGMIPFDGIILAHSNETEWETFRNDNKNEAFIDRIYIVKVPYNLRVSEEIKIYEKILNGSELAGRPCAPHTLKALAQFAVHSRLVVPENSSIWAKVRVYDGESLKDSDIRAKALHEYRDIAGVMEGMKGISTRFCFKVLSRVYNFDVEEIAADPVHLFEVLLDALKHEQLSSEIYDRYAGFIKDRLVDNFLKLFEKDMQEAYLDSYAEYGQALFDRYILFADHWLQDQDYRDPDTGQLYDRNHLNKELEVIEKAAKIANSHDFRHDIVNYALRYRASNKGQNPKWTAYEKIKKVIEANMFEKTSTLLPVISFDGAGSEDEKKKHKNFLSRMRDKGYTDRQVRRAYTFYQQCKA